jgi:hypothetical protein
MTEIHIISLLFSILISRISCLVLAILVLFLLPVIVVEMNLVRVPNAFAQILNPYPYNPYNTYTNPFFLTNPTTSALSTAVNAPLIPPFGLQQQISPWFPSVPAIACGTGLFSFTIQGVPDKDVHMPNDDNDDELMALQIQLDNNNGITILNDDVEGQIAVGEKDIERQKWEDYDVEDMFNACRTLAYSSSPDVDKNIKTPLPTMVLSDDGIPITPLTAFANTRNYPYYPYYYPDLTVGIGERCPAGTQRDPNNSARCIPY